MRFVLTFLSCLLLLQATAQKDPYAHPLKTIRLSIEQQPVKMVYMDVLPTAQANGRTVVLLHGKNFNGYYWKEVISYLSGAGYRVVVPDQVGWGYSDKPNIHYSFHLLAANTKALLDSLGIGSVLLVGHSMGGMLATRLTLQYPQLVERLVLENPIGLEDYRTFVPYRSPDQQMEQELGVSVESLRQYQQSYYPEWRPEYDAYVTAQWDALQYPELPTAAWASALTYNMIIEQPVLYEWSNLRMPVLLVIGQEDRTVVGKGLLSPVERSQHGNYPELGRMLQKKIKGSKLVPLPGVGHIPHIQAPDAFRKALLDFLP